MRETKPGLTLLPALWLAPGILAVAACVAIAATYYHPALAERRAAIQREPEALALDRRPN